MIDCKSISKLKINNKTGQFSLIQKKYKDLLKDLFTLLLYVIFSWYS